MNPILGMFLASGVLGAFLAQQAWSFWPEVCCPGIELSPPPADAIDPCEPVGKDIGRDLTTKGYTIVPDAISEEDRAMLMMYANQLPTNNNWPGYRMPSPLTINEITPEVARTLEKTIAEVQRTTSINVTTPDGHLVNTYFEAEFVTVNPDDQNKSVNLGWHQDYESWYYSQHTNRYLMLYIVIDKPNPLEGGLEVVPFDTMKQRAPGLYDLTYGRGASSWQDQEDGGSWMKSNHVYDKLYYQNFHLKNISCAPRLKVGDLMLFRGDVVHRTQMPVLGHRTMLGLRVSHASFDIGEMLTGGRVKYTRMMNNYWTFMHRSRMAKVPNREPWDVSHAWALQTWLWVRLTLGFSYRVLLSNVRTQLGLLAGEKNFNIPVY